MYSNNAERHVGSPIRKPEGTAAPQALTLKTPDRETTTIVDGAP